MIAMRERKRAAALRTVRHGFLTALLAVAAAPAFANTACEAEPGVQMASFGGDVQDGAAVSLPAGASFVTLTPIEHGWRIGLKTGGGEDLPVLAPPIRPLETNPVNIAGWHFRNAANTGPNIGDVNAPQQVRTFVFGRAAVRELLEGAPPPGSRLPPETGEAGDGRLTIDDFRLTDLSPGQKARMIYLKVSGCLTWRTPPREPDLALDAEPGANHEPVVAAMRRCRLDPRSHRLSSRMTRDSDGGQAWLEPDLNGDGKKDFVASIIRRSDGAPGLAMCLSAGDRLILAGFEGRIGRHLDPAFFDRADFWSVHPPGQVAQANQEGAPPYLKGEGVLLGKQDASSVLVYLDDGLRVSSYWQGD